MKVTILQNSKLKLIINCFIINFASHNSVTNDYVFTGHKQTIGAGLSVTKEFISHLIRAQHILSAARTVQISHELITILQYMHLGSRDTRLYGSQSHLRLCVACPL
jgi:hypothetical protein